jgi:hypothetical protein
MNELLALSQAAQTTITDIGVWGIAFPALITALIACAFIQARGERRADEAARERRDTT